MSIDATDPSVETVEEFVVAGLAHRGPPEENHRDLWTDFAERVEDLAALTDRDEIYGVVFEYDESGDDFTYVAGVPVDDPDALVPELTAVEIPGGPYARFESSVGNVEDEIERITDEWADDSEYERASGPMFERFPADADPSDPSTPAAFFVPVEEA